MKGNFQFDIDEIAKLVLVLQAIGGIEFDDFRMKDSLQKSDKKSLLSIYKVVSGESEEEEDNAKRVV
jgi:hypothetical protein